MTNREAIKLLKGVALYADTEYKKALTLAISALEKQEQSCDTCRHGRFGDRQCDNCGVRYPNHYEAEEES
jgi:hypothetical protein